MTPLIRTVPTTEFPTLAAALVTKVDLQATNQELIINCSGLVTDTVFAEIKGFNTGVFNQVTINFINGYRMESPVDMIQINESWVTFTELNTLLLNPTLDDRNGVRINAAGVDGKITIINGLIKANVGATKHMSGLKVTSGIPIDLVNTVITGHKDNRGGTDNNTRSYAIVAGSLNSPLANITIYGGDLSGNKNRIRNDHGGTVLELPLSDYTGPTPPVVTPPVIEKSNPIYGLGTAALSVNSSGFFAAKGIEVNTHVYTHQKQGAMHEIIAVLGSIVCDYTFDLGRGLPVQAMFFGGLSGSENTITAFIFNNITGVYDELATLKGTDEVLITPESFIRITPEHKDVNNKATIKFTGTGLVPDAAGNEAKLSIQQAFVNYVEPQIAHTGGAGGTSVDNSAQIAELQLAVSALITSQGVIIDAITALPSPVDNSLALGQIQVLQDSVNELSLLVSQIRVKFAPELP